MPDYKIRFNKKSAGLNVLGIDVSGASSKHDCHFMLSSDEHYDSKHCDRKLLKHMLDKAADRDAPIFFNGDWFDVMQGKGDRRASRDEIDADYANTDAYFDAVLERSYEFLKPYREFIVGIGFGNHEASVRRYYGTDMSQRLVYRLNKINGRNPIVCLGYTGYILYGVKNKRRSNRLGVINIRYHHGTGKGGDVTGNRIKANRRSVYLDNADIVWSGHTHKSDWHTVVKESISSHGVVTHRMQYHIVTPGFKNQGGWERSMEFSPQPRGCAWGVYRTDKNGVNFEVTMDLVS